MNRCITSGLLHTVVSNGASGCHDEGYNCTFRQFNQVIHIILVGMVVSLSSSKISIYLTMSTTKSNGKKHKPNENKSRSEVQHPLHQGEESTNQLFQNSILTGSKLTFIFLLGTSLGLSISVQEFIIATYLLLILIVKQNLRTYNRLSDCIKDGLPCKQKIQENKDLDSSFNVTFIDSISFIFNVFTL